MAMKRPGGLTALAVLNFVFGGIGAIVAVIGFGGLALVREGIKNAEAHGGKYDGPSLTMATVVVGLTAFGALLLIVSGVGYLKQAKFSGRTLGTLYGLVSLGGTVATAATGGIGIGSILLAVYPLLTLILINTTFKNDLVN
ncbi:MAG: hypothetical protein WKG01_02155 [Kofleriaceae bacterium]